MSLGDKVRRLDIFKKVPTSISEGTNRGGFISLITLLSVCYFLLTEIRDYMNPEMEALIGQDKLVTRKQMKINLDITFPNFPCEIISLDIQDIMLSHKPNLGSIQKFRLDSNENRIDSQPFQLLRQPDQNRQYDLAKEAFQKKYGCQLVGSFTVKEVPGNFHISSHAYQNIFARLRIDDVVKTLDVSHKINSLYFGDINSISEVERLHPEATLTKLKGHSKIYNMKDAPHSYTSHYHIDIVPTIYHDSYWSTHAYQYTYNHNTFEVYHMPSLYFNYHIGGLVVQIRSTNDAFNVFLVKLCAIIGGTYAIASFVDNFLDALFDDRRKQYELIN